MITSDKNGTCHPELYRRQCTYPIFFQWSPESWLRARFEACRWGQCTIHLQARGVWAQTPVKVCSMQQKPAGLPQPCSHREWSLRSGKGLLTLDPHLPEDTAALRRKWKFFCFVLFFFFYMMQQTMSIRICNIWSVAHHKWRTPAGVSWCRGSRGPRRSEYQPGLSSSLCHDTCGTPSSEPRATNTLQ